MQIKSNILLKILVPVVILVVVMIGVKSCGSQKSSPDQTGNAVAADLTREELRLLGVEGDTPQDTLRTLLGRIKPFRKIRIIWRYKAAHWRRKIPVCGRRATMSMRGSVTLSPPHRRKTYWHSSNWQMNNCA